MSENTQDSIDESTVIPTDQIPVETSVAPEKVPAKEEPTQETIVKKQNVTQQVDVLNGNKGDKTKWDNNADTLDLPSVTADDLEAVRTKIPSNTDLAKTPEQVEWLQTVQTGNRLTMRADIFNDRLNSDTVQFEQIVNSQTDKLAPAKLNQNIKAGELSGERATIAVINALGIGTMATVPLWHTGMWVTFKAPSEASFLELQRAMIDDKIRVGRDSYGLAFSNTTAYTTERLVNFALSHVYRTSLSDVNSDDPVALKKILSCHDIPSLLLGVLCTIYPNGFQYKRACMTDPEKCNHVAQERLNLFKIQWTNSRGLTAWQNSHMAAARASNSKKLVDIEKYQSEMLDTQPRTVIIKGNNRDITTRLKVPNIEQYIQAGHSWIGGIAQFVNGALGVDTNNDERNNYITLHSQATAMRQFSHWVESISMDFSEDGPTVIRDQSSLEEVIGSMSSDDSIRNNFIEEVTKYINDSAISVIGIPVYDCPSCGSEQTSEVVYPKATSIIPLDMYQTFFALFAQRLARITTR